MRKIVNIVINYANENEVLEYAKRLSKQTIACSITLIIVVNKKSNMTTEDFKSNLSEIDLNVLVFDPCENLGYLNGLIFGYNQYSKEIKDKLNWVVMSNTDIEFCSDKFFETFLKNIYADDIWCIGPSVYSPEKKSYDNPKSINRYTLKGLNRRIFIFKHPRMTYCYRGLSNLKAKLIKRNKKDSQTVYSVHGCFFIARNEFLEVLINKKYKALLYSEEAYISEVIRLHRKKCFYDNTIEVIHNEHTITSKLDIKKVSKYYVDSLKSIRDEFFIVD